MFRALVPPVELALLTYFENVRPMRRAVEDKVRRFARNASFSLLAASAIQACELPVVYVLARFVERHQFGLVFALPAPLRVFAAVALMDYTLYLWHVLAHKAPVLWRLHRVHHADLDLDASTALRFHFLEHVASTPWRAMQVLLIGVTPHAFAAWQAFLMANVLFHHSNVKLPPWAERILRWFVATPHLHGIHHSTNTVERESNWSSGFTLWDRIHGTYQDKVDAESIVIGLPEYRDPDAVRFARLVTMPLDEPTP